MLQDTPAAHRLASSSHRHTQVLVRGSGQPEAHLERGSEKPEQQKGSGVQPPQRLEGSRQGRHDYRERQVRCQRPDH